MAFRHCHNCGEGLDEPTVQEDIEGQVCYRCGSHQHQHYSEGEWLIKLEERIWQLEEKVNGQHNP